MPQSIEEITQRVQKAGEFISLLNNETKKIKDEISKSHNRTLELSMGMSNDYKTAIKCGSTMVRIGTKLFGERK